MLDFITTFFETLLSILKLVFQFICDIPDFLKVLLEVFGAFPSYLFFLPEKLITVFGFMTAFALVYKFLGREG